jgi:hypothetical protein
MSGDMDAKTSLHIGKLKDLYMELNGQLKNEQNKMLILKKTIKIRRKP